MKHFVNRGSTIQLNWTLHSISGQEFALTGHTYRLFFATGNQSAQATGVTHSGNVLSWTFTPDAQWKLGSYIIWLEVYNNGTKIVTVAYPDAFHLVHEVASSGTTQTGTQTESTTLNLVSSCDFYRFAPVIPVAGDDGYWYVNGVKAVDGNGEYILTSHTLEYDEQTRNLIIDKDRVDSEGNSIEQVITALADLDRFYQEAEGSEDGSEAGDGSRWGAYKTAEAARDSAAQNAETARQTAADNAEGTKAGSTAGDGSRWGEFKSAEAERETASETAIERANAAAAAAEHMVDIHQGPPGDDGDSAYEIAVQEGFVGTKAEWLASLDGSDGTGIDEVEQTETSIANGGTNKVRITLTNGTYYDIQIKNGSSSNGLFPTSSALAAACPSPKVGDYAFVGDGFPADIYVCETAGTWTDSGEDFDGGNVDLTDYAKKAELTQLEQKLNTLALTRYYGIFESSSLLPADASEKGYAYVGEATPLSIYEVDYNSESEQWEWTDTGVMIDSVQGEPGEDGVGLADVSTPLPYDGTVVLILSNGDRITLDLNHNHPEYYSKVLGGEQPVGGFLPDVVYSLGTLSGTVAFTLAAAVTGNVNHYFWMFDTSSTAPTITWPTGITWAAGAAPTVAASKHYEISILGGIAYYSEV